MPDSSSCKLFLHGLPPDCQENNLRDFLEDVCGIPGAVTKLHIPKGKKFAFATLLQSDVADGFLGKVLLYCDDLGELYQVKAFRFQQRRSLNHVPTRRSVPVNNMMVQKNIHEAVKYKPPQHVHFTPDFNMLSQSKPKKSKRKRGDSFIWFGDCGARTKKQVKAKKRKKKNKGLVVHPSESFQFDLVTPKGKSTPSAETSVTAAKDSLLTANNKLNSNERKLSTADSAVKSLHICTEKRNPHFQPDSVAVPDQNSEASGTGTLHANNKASPRIANQECSSEELNFPRMEATSDINGSFIIGEYGSAFSDERLMEIKSLSTVDQVKGNAAVSEVGHDTLISNQDSGTGDMRHPISPVARAELSSTIRQVIIEHGYLGPLCFDISDETTVNDIKDEIMERTGLPVADQILTYNCRRLCDSFCVQLLFDENPSSVTMMLFEGCLKGGVQPKQVQEGAVGGEHANVEQDQAGGSSLMETWDADKTALWMRKVGLSKKYVEVCQREHISGRALLLLGIQGPERLKQIFQLKQGPLKILLDSLKSHLDTFDNSKPQVAIEPEEIMKDWTIERLCSWLRCLRLPEVCIKKLEEEEINGQAFLLMKDSHELQECLELKAGSLLVIQRELSLCEEAWSGDCSNICKEKPILQTKTSGYEPSASRKAASNQLNQETEQVPYRELEDKTPLPSKNMQNRVSGLSREKEILELLQNALKLSIELPQSSQTTSKLCSVRSIFVKRGGGANALEKIFNFIAITSQDELSPHEARQLWTKVRNHTSEWITLFTDEDASQFNWEDGLLYSQREEGMVELRDGQVSQIFLEKLSQQEFTSNYFVILIDEDLLQKKNVCSFLWDKKGKRSFTIQLGDKEKNYHASFKRKSIARGLKWSKGFRLRISTSKSKPGLQPKQDGMSSAHDNPRVQTLRTFNSELGNTTYTEGFVLNCSETGAKDLMTPIHELKLFRKAVDRGEEESIKKFVFETLRFACACLNERTNGTIHFGVADEVETQAHAYGYQPRQVVGVPITNPSLYCDKLTEYIDKCFVGSSKSNVHNCVRPPLFVPVKRPQLVSGDVVIEVDIEPSYSMSEGEIFKIGFKALGRGEKEAQAYRRHGSHTQEMSTQDIEDYLKHRMSKLDQARKTRENKQPLGGESPQRLFVKLQRLLCANKKCLDSSLYPVLVTTKPDAHMTQEFLEENFSFIQSVKWLVTFDFDAQGSSDTGLCKVFKSGPNAPPCDLNEADDFDQNDDLIDSIYYQTRWIFGNGYEKLGKKAASFRQWNNSERKRGISQVIQSLSTKIPASRAVVLFLLLSKDYQAVADMFKDFCTYLDGPNQLVYIAENSDVAADWEAELSRTCLEERELRERGVVGMMWCEFQECVKQMICGTDPHQCYVAMATGSLYPLKRESFCNLDVLSATECKELETLEPGEREEKSSVEEDTFYRGYPVTWTNFWFTSADRNHVLRRDNYSNLKAMIEKMFRKGPEGKVHTITLYHHIGAGASTMCRQALWDFRHNEMCPYRCALVKRIDDNTCVELLRLRRVGCGDDKEASCPPVLALVEDIDDLLFRELRRQVLDQASGLPRTVSPVCVFLYCKATLEPFDCHSKEKETSVYLEQKLTSREVMWFKDKYTEMERKSHRKDSGFNFNKYASENLISFMIMKENFNPHYAKSIVERNLDHVTDDEMTLLQYTSLLNIYDPFPVFVSCFDTIMLSSSFLRRKIFRDWCEGLTHSARVFLREVDCSTHAGTGKAITIVHPVIASKLLDQTAKKKELSVGQIALNFLRSAMLTEKMKYSFTSKHLREGVRFMLKHRKKYEYGDETQTKFSPLIEKILYVEETATGGKKATEQTINQAVELLEEGLEKFNDPMLAQQIARVFYVNASDFSESNRNSCFERASEFCERAIEMNPNNSFVFDTMGRIQEAKIKVLYAPIREENRKIEIEDVTPLLPLAFKAIEWFQKSQAASKDDQNKFGFHGELKVMFYLLNIFRCTGIFGGGDGMKRLQAYLASAQKIPPEVDVPWKDYHQFMKKLGERFSVCMEEISEEFTIYKDNTVPAKVLPKQIASFRAQYHDYFGECGNKGNTPEERREYRWQQINQYLGGTIFSSVFKIDGIKTKVCVTDARETLQLLRNLVEENRSETGYKENYKDLLLMITTKMALHSPYGKGNRRSEPSGSVEEEYKETYRMVEKLCALEESDVVEKRLYAHLFKVMFLWPREDSELQGDHYAKEFDDALKKIKQRWNDKSTGGIDTDKTLKENVYKQMSFKKETRQYTTLFYLGKGSGLDVFVHVNELPVPRRGKESIDWGHEKLKKRLRRLNGVVESKNTIRVTNPLDSSRSVEVYYSPFNVGGFSKEEVSFYLGFSWYQPIALDVCYTSTHLRDNRRVESNTQFFPLSTLSWHVVTYEYYIAQKRKLSRKLEEINFLKKKKKEGEKLDGNQEEKVKKESECKKQLEELKEMLVVPEEFFD